MQRSGSVSKLNYKLIAVTMESQVKHLWRLEDEYLRGNNPDGAKSVREEIVRVNEQIDLVKDLSLKLTPS